MQFSHFPYKWLLIHTIMRCHLHRWTVQCSDNSPAPQKPCRAGQGTHVHFGRAPGFRHASSRYPNFTGSEFTDQINWGAVKLKDTCSLEEKLRPS